MSFKNKVVVITGGSGGIGAATAKLFAKEGASLAIVGRNEDKLKEVTQNCVKVTSTTLAIKADMSNDADVKRIVDKTIETFGKIDVLVNNAGLMFFGSVLKGNIMDKYDAIMNTNLRGTVLLTSYATPHLVKTKGNIVNVSSILASSFFGNSEWLAYSMSKSALNTFTKGIAFDLASVDIRVNTVSPGLTRTGLLKKGGFKLDLDQLQAAYDLKSIAKPEEIGDLIMFLASEKAKGINGADFVLDYGALVKK